MSASGGIAGATGTPVANSANGGNQPNTATLPAVAARTNYLTGFEVTASGATAGADVQVTVTGVVGGPFNYTFTFPAGVAVPATPLVIAFLTPIPATGPNIAIAVAVPAGGVGNTNASVVAHGYVL